MNQLTIKNQIVLLIFSSFFLITSCQNKSNFEVNLVKEDAFWYIFDFNKEQNKYENINYGYKFYKNNSCEYMHYDFSSNKLLKFEVEDIVSDETWELNIKDSIIRIQNFKYKITSYSKDTIHLQFIRDNKLTNLREKLINLSDDKKP